MKNENENTKPNLSKEQVESVYALYTSGKIKEAIERIKILNEDYPNVPLLFNILGACYQANGQFEGAIQMFETATKLKSDYAEAHFNLGVVLKELGRFHLAIKSYKKAITIVPNYPDAHNNLGTVYKELGDAKAAIESYEWALAYKPEYIQAMVNIGAIYSDYDQKTAIKYYKKAISINPDYAEPHFALGSVLRHLGEKNDSIKSYEKALAINPEHVDAHKDLGTLKKYTIKDPQIAVMGELIARNGLSQSDYIGLNYALAKVYGDLENQKQQFKFLNEGNKLRKKQLNYSFDKDKQFFSEIKKSFKSPYFAKKQSLKSEEKCPIFIVGMPRSGTTLVEQIISSHHDVYGAGELETITRVCYPALKENIDGTNEFSENFFLSIREEYLDYLSGLNAPEKFITDKMPANFRFIGFILAAFPDAKIIHMKRDSMATCWSIYQYYFRGTGNGYSYNLKDLAQYYLLYEDLMSYWHNLFPDKIFDLNYESLTTNQEEETRKLLKYCNLDWNKSCLNFQNNKRAVKTASALQIRQKMYQGSSEVWKKYESYLQPLLKGLKYKT